MQPLYRLRNHCRRCVHLGCRRLQPQRKPDHLPRRRAPRLNRTNDVRGFAGIGEAGGAGADANAGRAERQEPGLGLDAGGGRARRAEKRAEDGFE